ncbi:MAG TPA: 50S ribosomal protein L14 [Candidatus Thermoplasmatota archaeon]|uniref:Large ribosomal subunit protein uL14 n=1 Tax=uncultured euryarchaeote Rifle_16ft_4_minimus_14142 TaxID=1665188 RepID=A0A0H4TKN1_9EURY|nr:50S ribosomal protein L14P [uncultured euryarchaeote Rifle_16ft_4_minimus_14142]HKZ59887.1 50S ribosomal protein L14 [Candidatus Thermoplasmatota archaeon]
MKGMPAKVIRALPKGARLTCADNTGAKIVEVVAVLKYHGTARRTPACGIGDLITVAVKKGTPEMRHQLERAVVIRQKKEYRRPDGTWVGFEDNACVLVGDAGDAKGSDIKGPVAREAAERWSQIAAKASMIV